MITNQILKNTLEPPVLELCVIPLLRGILVRRKPISVLKFSVHGQDEMLKIR